jgi:hypothetical protein
LDSLLVALPQMTGDLTPPQLKAIAHRVSGIQQIIATAPSVLGGDFEGSWAGSRRPSKELSTVDFNASTAAFSSPVGTALSDTRPVFVSDRVDGRVWVTDSTGRLVPVWDPAETTTAGAA